MKEEYWTRLQGVTEGFWIRLVCVPQESWTRRDNKPPGRATRRSGTSRAGDKRPSLFGLVRTL